MKKTYFAAAAFVNWFTSCHGIDLDLFGHEEADSAWVPVTELNSVESQVDVLSLGDASGAFACHVDGDHVSWGDKQRT